MNNFAHEVVGTPYETRFGNLVTQGTQQKVVASNMFALHSPGENSTAFTGNSDDGSELCWSMQDNGLYKHNSFQSS